MSDTQDAITQVRETIPNPVFNPTLVPMMVDSETLHIRGGAWRGPIMTLVDRGDRTVVRDLVGMIDGETHVDEILDSFSEDEQSEIAATLHRLYEVDAIHDASEYADQLHNHVVMRGQFQQVERESIESKRVLLLNAGRMGNWIAEHLLEMGVGHVELAEPIDGTGRPVDHLQGDGFEYIDELDLETAVERSDFVVYTAEQPYPELEDRINRITHESRTPWVIGQIHGYDGFIGPAIFPGETACLECFRTRVLANATNPDGLQAYWQANHRSQRDELATVTLPPFAHAVAGFLSIDLLHLLAYGVGYTAGRAIWMNSIDFSIDADHVLQLPRCDVCGVEPGVEETPFMTLRDAVEVTEFDAVSDQDG